MLSDKEIYKTKCLPEDTPHQKGLAEDISMGYTAKPIPTIIILVFLGFAFGLTNLLVIATYILAIEAVAIVTTGLTTLVVSVYRLVKDRD